MLQNLSYDSITDMLEEIAENGDMYGYSYSYEGYYAEYKDHFDELSAGAYELLEEIRFTSLRDHWDDMTVALLGQTTKVLGFDSVQNDYFGMLNHEEDWAVEEAMKRLERFTKRDLITNFRRVLVTLVSFFDIKAAHDCLTSIVEELDERAAIMKGAYGNLGGVKSEDDIDQLIKNMPNRAWIE